MNTRLSANLSVLGTSLMLILSFSFGFHSYTEAKKTIVTDLNQALQQTILQNSHLWMSQDSRSEERRVGTEYRSRVSAYP